MKVLITGGAGFIGTATVEHFKKDKTNEILIVDLLSYASNKDALKNNLKNKNVNFIKGSICDRKFLNTIFKQFKPEKIIHLAAESHVDTSINDPKIFIYTNILGTYELLVASLKYYENLKQKQKPLFRFHHVSTDEVYGDLPLLNEVKILNSKERRNLFFSEESSYNPSSPYAASKAASDHLVRAWHRTYNLPITISNCSNNFGPYQNKEKLIPHMIYCALNNKPLPVYGNGQQVRDWLYVSDHVKAFEKILLKGKIGETYNIGARCEKTNLEIINLICLKLDTIFDKKYSNSYKNLITFVEDRRGHDIRYAIDPTKIEKELNWKPDENFESSLDKTIEFYTCLFGKN